MSLWYNIDAVAYLTIRKAAEKLGTDEATIREWIERGLLKDIQRRVSFPTSGELMAALVAEDHVEEKELLEVAEDVGFSMLTRKTLLKRLNARR